MDALAVGGLAESAAAARQAGDQAAVVDAADEALALFRGEVLVDAGDGDWLAAHRARLDEVRLGLVEDRLGGAGCAGRRRRRDRRARGAWSSSIRCARACGRR